ncbi:MAG: DUF4358 domain-containing protein [Clostridia bacterium]|nr:DUF4358 domain-containing protein [Clostridia bacterium]
MKKIVRLFTVLIVSLLVVSLCACSGSQEERDNAKEIDIYAASSALLEAGKFDDVMTELPHYAFPSVIGDIGAVTASFSYCGESGATSDAVFLVYCDDLENLYTVKALVSNYRDEQERLFVNYNPTEVPKLNNAVIEVRGHYLMFAVGSDVSALSGIFNGYFDN